jgi:hypothetical protein
MMPGGHLATSIALSAGVYASSGSTALAAGCFAGGFLIDVDHYLDYIVFEGQWRRPDPASFLRYYFTGQAQKMVLPLHSLELMMALTMLTAIAPHPLLTGYLAGAAMHLLFDVLVNGEHALRMPVLFYSFAYRASQRFSVTALLDPVSVPAHAGARPWKDFFFRWLPTVRRQRRVEGDTPRVPGAHQTETD